MEIEKWYNKIANELEKERYRGEARVKKVECSKQRKKVRRQVQKVNVRIAT